MKTKQVTIGGVEFTVREGTWDEYIVKCVFAWDEYNLRSLVNRMTAPRLIVDIGAHIGSFAAAASRTWPAADVYSFEAFTETYNLLRKNVEKLANVWPVHFAVVGDNWTHEVSFKTPEQAVGEFGSNTGSFAVDATGEVKEPACGIGYVFHILGNRNIDLLKLDCEGSEDVILTAAQKDDWLRKIGVIIGEWHTAPRKDVVASTLNDTHRVTFFKHPSDENLGYFEAFPK